MTSEKYQKMSDHELLSEILEKSAKAEKHRRITMYAVLAAAVCLFIALALVIPRVLALIKEAEILLSQANEILKQVQPAVESFSEINFEGLSESINVLQDTITKFSDVMAIFGR